MSSAAIIIRQLGIQPYQKVWKAMQAFTDARNDSDLDEIWLVEHPPVFTQGQAGKPEHLLDPGDIPVIKVDRGGQVTYHGPGQLVVYLMINIRRRKLGIRQLVTAMEQSLIRLLNDYNIAAKAKPDAPGVYVEDNKIASLGLRVRKGCTFHGLALNVKMELDPFLRINPCGYAGLKMTQLSALKVTEDIEDISSRLIAHLLTELNYESIEHQSGLDKRYE